MAKKPADSFDPSQIMNFFDPAKVMEQFAGSLNPGSVAGVDMGAFVTSQRKNFSALAEANQQVMTGAREVMQKQTELLKKSTAEATSLAQELATGGLDPAQLAAKQGELMTLACVNTMDNIRDASEMIAKAQQEALAVLEQRWQEGVAELRELSKI